MSEMIANVMFLGGIGAIIAGLFLIPGPRDVLEAVLFFVGGALVVISLFVAEAAGPNAMGLTRFIAGLWKAETAAAMCILFIFLIVMCIAGKITIASHKIQGLLILGGFACVWAIVAWCCFYFSVNSKFRTLESLAAKTKVIRVEIAWRTPLQLIQEEAALPAPELQKWMRLTEKRILDEKKMNVTITKIHRITSRSHDGQIIHEHLVRFSGTNNEPLPGENPEITSRVFSIKSNMDQATTDSALDDLIRHLGGDTTTGLWSSQNPVIAGTNTDVILPPTPSPFGA